MLTNDSKTDFQTLATLLVSEVSDAYVRALAEKRSAAAATGQSRGGMFALECDRLGADFLAGAAERIYHQLLKVYQAQTRVADESDALALHGEFAVSVVTLHQLLEGHRNHVVKAALGNAFGFGHLRALTDAMQRIVIQYKSEIRVALRAQANNGVPPQPMQHTYNFHSQVGAVQTGAGSTANVQQQVGAFANSEQFRAAIESIIAALQASSSIPEPSRSNAIELFSELRHEDWTGPKNKGMVKTALLGISATIQTLADVDGAVAKILEWGSAV